MSAWFAERLKDVATINRFSLPASTDLNYQFKYIEISNVDYFGIVDDGAIEQLRFEDAPSRARRVVSRYSTIISSVRPNLQAAAYFPSKISDLICSTGFNVVEPDSRLIHPKFAYYSLISEGARQYFEAVATGVGYPAVSDKAFGTYVIRFPELAGQTAIARFLDGICNITSQVVGGIRSNEVKNGLSGVLTRQAEALIAYRKSLIHECVTGQRRITDADVHRLTAHAATLA